MKLNTLLFDTYGDHNTLPTLEIARDRASELGITQLVVASSHGSTALIASKVFAQSGARIIAVSISHGWESEGWVMADDEKQMLLDAGVIVHTGIHALGDGVGSAFSDKYGGRVTEEIVRDTLYRFSQGMKVAVECLLMAADAGLLDMNQEVISIAGTSSGADTAIVCKPAYPRTFHALEILEILAKPRKP